MLTAALALGALSGTTVLDAATTPAGAAGVRVVVQPCAGKPEVRPTSFTIACGDGNAYLTKLTWSAWGATSAEASAVYTVNNCDPYCAAGKFISSKAEVTLSKPKTVKGHRYFTNLRVGYVSGPKFKSYNFALLT
jgi:hypothetical protein